MLVMAPSGTASATPAHRPGRRGLPGGDPDPAIELAVTHLERRFAVEPRGSGETAPRGDQHDVLSRRLTHIPRGLLTGTAQLEFEVALDCLMLGRSLLGQQLQDVHAAIGYVRTTRTGTAMDLWLRAQEPRNSLR